MTETTQEISANNAANKDAGLVAGAQQVLFAQTPNPDITVGVVTSGNPSALTLLAAGVAGVAARRALRQQTKLASK